MRMHVVLDEKADADLILWWQSRPKGQRTAELRRILRWYLVPGGFRDLVAAMDTRPSHPIERAPSEPPPNFQETLNATLAAFGWDDDDT